MQKLLFIVLIVLTLACCEEDVPDHPLDEYRLTAYTCDHYKYTFEYDSLNRIAKSGTYYDEQLVYDTRFFYVAGRLDSLISATQFSLMQYETFRYVDDTLVVSTYRYAFDEKIRRKYALDNNQIVKILNPPCVEGDSSYICYYQVLHWDNNNLTYKHIYTSIGYTYPDYKSTENTSGSALTNSIWSTYDNHPNPLKSIFEQIYPGEYESSENNLLRMVITDMGGDTLIRNFKHTYNDIDLPVATSETREKNDTPLNADVSTDPSASTYTYEKYR